MLLLFAELTAKPSSINKVEVLLRSLVDITRDEPGNIVYAVHQRNDDPHRFVLYELYVDQAACNEHLQREWVRNALKQIEPLLEVPAQVTFCSTVAVSGIDSSGAPLR